jgi:hypothetical protein
MTTTQWLLGWWNLVFLVPLGLALLYLALYVVSGVTFGDADADADANLDADAGLDAEAGADAEGDADTDHGDHSDHHGNRSGAAGALAWIGVGRVPLSLVLMVLLMTWGFIGFVTTQFLRDAMPRYWMIPLVSLPAAALGSLLATRTLTRVMSRLMPTDETYAKRRNELLGEVGDAIYAIDERFGMANVRDDRGTLHQVPCRVEPGRPPVAKGAKVLLVSYDSNRNIYHVMPDGGGVLARDRAAASGARSGVTKGGLS